MMRGSKPVEILRVKITDAGRRASASMTLALRRSRAQTHGPNGGGGR
jgi:hypothetical protein